MDLGSCKLEHMFEKVVTPSDVGKLNRLVIPKQHAEKYFPLDSAAGEKGLLLNFEESSCSGKSWRFRYSYWSSSQSYVITKGWSRFVKDKNLFAGDIVCFLRDSADGRFFIDWRRRPAEAFNGISLHRSIHLHHHPSSWYYNSSSVTHPSPSPLMVGPGLYNYDYGVISPSYACLHNHNQFGAAATSAGPTLLETVVPAVAKHSKRLRLFGVNMTPNDVLLPSSSSHSSVPAAALQLRLHASDPTSSSAATKMDLVTANFLDKGKSSLSLDLGVSSHPFGFRPI